MIERLRGTFPNRQQIRAAIAAFGVMAAGAALPAFATGLTAESQSPAVLADGSISLTLTAHATVPSGQTAWIQSISTTGAHGAVAWESVTAVKYTPGAYYDSLPKGSNATDKFGFCLTDTAGATSCGTVSVQVVGTAAAATTTPSTPTAPAETTTSYSCLRNWYVAQNGSDRAAGNSASTPWATIQHADQSGLLRAGDCVNLANGTYVMTNTAYLSHGGNANSPTGYVVYRAEHTRGARLRAAGSLYDVVQAEANYLIVDGLEIDGGNEGLTRSPVTAGHCLEAVGHHFQALNNLAHDCGGAGITAEHHDWYWFEGNTVYNDAEFNGYQSSGLSIYEPTAVSFTPTSADYSAAYHIIVKNNVAYDNGEWYVPGDHTDGNGIILDDFLHTQSDNVGYPYKTLVEGNTTYGNGARGIHAFHSNNAVVTGNVAYGNNRDTRIPGIWRGELSNAFGNNNSWTNNKATATSVPGDIRAYNTAVLDGHAGSQTTGVIWSGNANYDTRTGGRSYQIDNPSRAAVFPEANPVGKPL